MIVEAVLDVRAVQVIASVELRIDAEVLYTKTVPKVMHPIEVATPLVLGVQLIASVEVDKPPPPPANTYVLRPKVRELIALVVPGILTVQLT